MNTFTSKFGIGDEVVFTTLSNEQVTGNIIAVTFTKTSASYKILDAEGADLHWDIKERDISAVVSARS